MKRDVRNYVLLGSILLSLITPLVSASANETYSESKYSEGVWNNFDYEKAPEEWAAAARGFGGEYAVVDLVVAQANDNGFTNVPFTLENEEYIYGSSQVDLAEPYLDKFDEEGLSVILSIQPMWADVDEVIDVVLSRYGHHKSVVGINVDLEWKLTGNPYHASNEERDIWLKEIKSHDPEFKLFMTYFGDNTFFPDDAQNLVILFDGEYAAQHELLEEYSELASHYRSVGIYTGYPSSAPPTASDERIIKTAPNTEYILHTYDFFSNRKTLLFEMEDIQADWLEDTSIDLMDLHLLKAVPVVCGVIPENLDNPDVGDGYLPIYLKEMDQEYPDVFEIGESGYTHNESEYMEGKSYEEQREIIEKGREILWNIGIEPSTFIPPYDSADETTIEAAKDLGFENVIFLNGDLSSKDHSIFISGVTLTESAGNSSILKSPEQLMEEIDLEEEDVVLVTYQVHDFGGISNNSINELEAIMDALKESKKYQFMTPRQYRENLNTGQPTIPTDTTPNQSDERDWRPFVLVGVAVAALFAIILARR